MDWFKPDFTDFAFSFLSVLFEGIPFLLLGSVISGLIDVFVSSERISRLLPKNAGAAIGLSGVMGLVLPMCECGSVIVIRRFIRKGLPVASAVTYMLAAPIVSPIVAMSTYAAFKGQDPFNVTALRLSLGFAIAVAIGFIVRQIPQSSLLQPRLLSNPPEKPRPGLRVVTQPGQPDFSDLGEGIALPRRFLLAVQSATADFLDVAFFFVIGTAITSLFNTAVSRDAIEPFATNTAIAIPAMMVLAALIALCSTTDAFIAATFTTFPFAAKLAFMLFGPVFDLKLFWLYGLIFRRRWVIALGIALFVIIAFVCGRIADLPPRVPVVPTPVPSYSPPPP